MLEELTISPNNVSFLGDPKTIRALALQYGDENCIIIGYSGALGLDITNSELSKEILEKPPEGIEIYQKPKITIENYNTDVARAPPAPWKAEPGRAMMYKSPINTTYCTDGKKNAFAIAEGLKIVKLGEDVPISDVFTAENEIGSVHSYFIGDTLGETFGGVFSAITHYLGNNILTDEEYFQNSDVFELTDGKINFSKKGEYILECLKETWDSTPAKIRSLCKMGINQYLSDLFGDKNEILLEDLEAHIKEKSEEGITNEFSGEIGKKYGEISSLLEIGVNRGYFNNNYDIRKLCDYLVALDAEKSGNISTIKVIEKRYSEGARQSFDAGYREWQDKTVMLFDTLLEKFKEKTEDYRLLNASANMAKNVYNHENWKSYKNRFNYLWKREIIQELRQNEQMNVLLDAIRASVFDMEIWTTEGLKCDKWKEDLKQTIEALKKRESDKVTYAAVYRGSIIKQLGLLEKGEYIKVRQLYENPIDFLENKGTNVRIIRGENFEHLHESGYFCPWGFSERWNTWKIEQQGGRYVLTKYFKNAEDKMVRISASSDGDFDVRGSATPDFYEEVKEEISLFEKIVNRNISGADKIHLKWEKIEEGSDNLSKVIQKPRERKPVSFKQKRPEFELHKKESQLLRQIRRNKKY